METMKRAAQRAIVDQKVVDYLMQPSLMSVSDLIELDRLSLQNIVRIQFNNPNIELIRIFMSNSSTNEMSPVLLHESRIRNAPWYLPVMEAEQKDVWVFSRSTRELFKSRSEGQEDKRPRISLYRELQYPQGTHVGILQVDMFLTNFFPNTFSALQDDQSQLVVIDRKGNFFRNPANGFLDRSGLTDEILQRQIAAIEPSETNKGSFEFKVAGLPFLAVYSYIEPLDSYMMKVASLKPVYDGINETRNRIILANVILLIILTVSTYYLNSFILKKLHVLTDSMKKCVKETSASTSISAEGRGRRPGPPFPQDAAQDQRADRRCGQETGGGQRGRAGHVEEPDRFAFPLQYVGKY